MSAAVDGAGPTLAPVRALREALRLVDAGYYLTPVTIRRTAEGDKAAEFHARWKRDPKAVTLDPDVVRDWSVQHACSFAIVCGPSGVEGADLDIKPEQGIDAVTWWATQGLPLGLLVVETPCGGLHTYWRRGQDRTLPTSAAEVAPGVDTRSAGGVFFAPGAFVLGVDGEPELTIYNVQGPLPKVIDLSPTPNVVLDAWSTRRKEPSSGTSSSSDYNGPTHFTQVQAKEYIQRKGTGPLKDAEIGHRNDALNQAALIVGHFVPAFFEEDRAVAQLVKLAREAGLDEREIGPTIRSGLSAGMALPFVLVMGDALDDTPVGVDPDEAFKRELERERIRRRVREELAAEDREPIQIMSASEFLNCPPPRYLVPRMFYRDGLSVVFGAPGAAKSFLVLDIALCLCSGKPWRGRALGRGKVHYIMAEGQATNILRTQAWLHHHELDVSAIEEHFQVIPTPVLLTEAGIRDYILGVERDKPDMIVLDTKNLMFAGKESQGDDYGAMLRVLHRIRSTASGAAVVLIDHSGLADDSRVRGSNAQKGGVETEVRVTNDNGVRRAEVTRDKSGSEGTEWKFKLVPVPGVPHGPDVDPPAVCVPLNEDEIRAVAPDFERDDNWNDPLQSILPDDIQVFSGKGANAIKPLARFMRYSARGSVGFSLTQARKAVFRLYVDEKGDPRWSEDTVQRAWQSLIDLDRLHPVKGASKTGNHVWEEREGDPE